MSLGAPEVAPVLSTPDTHVFEDPTPAVDPSLVRTLSDEQLYLTYEIKRTVDEIRHGRYRRIALQFPDHMLTDAPRVFEALQKELRTQEKDQDVTEALDKTSLDAEQERLCILGDTSYGACCVDEVAAEHVHADVVVHYGRTCLSPTQRLPVIYVFTFRPLDLDSVVASFQKTYPEKDHKVVLMADIPYSDHVQPLQSALQNLGYTSVFSTSIVHNPSSLLPNRTVPAGVDEDATLLRDYSLFHISEPPTSLLLNLTSRVASIDIYPTVSEGAEAPQTMSASTAQILRRRYALVTNLSTVSVFGILINTLSVKNYMEALSHVQDLITRAGKKYYTFVVGKVNAAKVANFSEVDGWVIIGCWESSLIESKDFWKPIITPFELELALTDERDRIWTGEWNSDFQSLLGKKTVVRGEGAHDDESDDQDGQGINDESDSESEAPVFDLRTGRYVSQSRPMARSSASASKKTAATSLIKRANGDLAQIGGEVSPAAEFLRSKRTWQGLGTDYEIAYDYDEDGNIKGAPMEEGRGGVARGYVVGDSERS
ncbi:putative diphthamide biosynthesis protein Dph2, partial [Aureobasidium melanogenum]